MNIFVINTTHPATPHISAVRAWRFAEVLSAAGHHVVLLCADPPDTPGTQDPVADSHDWSRPLVLPCGPADACQSGNLFKMPILRKARTLLRILLVGGSLGTWAEAAYQRMLRLSREFRPDIVWAVFGNLESLLLAHRFACHEKVPWVGDIKDNWELFVPAGLRRFMAWRVRGSTALTCNSLLERAVAMKWLQKDPELVYSGVDPAFYLGAENAPGMSGLRINLIGSLYDNSRLNELLLGIHRWHAALPACEQNRVSLAYLGGDVGTLRQAMARIPAAIPTQVLGFVPVAALAASCRAGMINCYIWHGGTFHHKLLELLTTGCPVLSYPGESEESRHLAGRIGGELLTPATPDQVVLALTDALRRTASGPAVRTPSRTAAEFSWERQGRVLETLLRRSVDGYREGCFRHP